MSSNQQNPYPNHPNYGQNPPNMQMANQPLPPYVPGGVINTKYGPVTTAAIKYKTLAHRGWSTAMFVLVALSGIGTFIILMMDPYYIWMALISTFMLAIGAGVIHMLESIVAELRRLG